MKTACEAPSVQLFFRPDGDVRACCVNELPLGNVRNDRLADIWSSPHRRQLVERLANHDYSVGCGTCSAEVEDEGRSGSYPATFDEWNDPGRPSLAPWPELLSFNLSIDCNLQCVQCDGDQSSAIRIHREGRVALPSVYDDRFFEDLPPFLAHARRALFSGGEPFLGAENFRTWSLVEQVAPGLDCRVITNATQWNRRVEHALAQVRMGFVFSIDGITAPTYEAIRVGADFDRVMANLERYLGYAERRGTPASINHCLMPQNVHEFADLLLFAEERNLLVAVSVVRKPTHHSLVRQSQSAIADAAALLREQTSTIRPRLRLNAPTWDREVARLSAWAEMDDGSRAKLWGVSQDTVGGFACEGRGPHDDRRAMASLRSRCPSGTIASFDIDTSDRISGCSPSARDLGLDPAELIGRPADQLADLLGGHLGPVGSRRVLLETADRRDLEIEFGDRQAAVVIVAMRDRDGRASRARVLVAVESSPAATGDRSPGRLRQSGQ